MSPANLVVLMFLAFVVTEGTVEYLLGTAFDKIEALNPFKWLLMYVSAGLGIFLAFYYAIDILSMIGLPEGPVGYAATGILLGRGANFINDLWQRFFPSANGR